MDDRLANMERLTTAILELIETDFDGIPFTDLTLALGTVFSAVALSVADSNNLPQLAIQAKKDLITYLDFALADPEKAIKARRIREFEAPGSSEIN